MSAMVGAVMQGYLAAQAGLPPAAPAPERETAESSCGWLAFLALMLLGGA